MRGLPLSFDLYFKNFSVLSIVIEVLLLSGVFVMKIPVDSDRLCLSGCSKEAVPSRLTVLLSLFDEEAAASDGSLLWRW